MNKDDNNKSNTEFNVPPGTPFVPESIVDEQKPSVKAVDPSRTVAGIDTSLKAESVVESSPVVVPDQQIDMRSSDSDKAEADVAAVEPEDVKHCPACGFNFDIKGEPDIDPVDKRRWLRHVLGEERFTKTHTLFDGALAVTFRTRTTAENDEVFEQLTADINKGLIPEAPAFASPAYIGRMYRYMLISSLASIEKVDPDGKRPAELQTFPYVTADVYQDDLKKPIMVAHDKILLSMSEAVVTALMNAHKNFEALIGTLITRSEDPDFWKPAVENN